ncbi:hypothetical protein [Pseudochelatococcus sp. G4_1912]|uniref:hypothetical protein n=1 Tax=Pseudochelatococcus sp. G4_1912 TaxID=3114288 RepID=UPI0039C5DFA2
MVSSINGFSHVSLEKYIGVNRTAPTVTETTKDNIQSGEPTQIVPQHIDDVTDIGLYSAFSARKTPFTNETTEHTAIESVALSKIDAAGKTPYQPDMKAWQDLFALANYLTTEMDFDTAFKTVSTLAIGWSFGLEEMQGQADLTDALRDEFAAELARYAPLAEQGEISSLIEYAAIRMTEMTRLSAPEGAKDFIPLSPDQADQLTIGIIIETFAKAFKDTMSSGDFFKQADASLWKALDILVTPDQEHSLDEHFYQYLHDNAEYIFKDVKDTTTPDPEKRFTLFSDLKTIIDIARQQYSMPMTVISNIFKQAGL